MPRTTQETRARISGVRHRAGIIEATFMSGSAECLRTDAIAGRDFRVRMRARMTLRVTFAPEGGATRHLPNREAVLAWGLDALPKTNRLGSVGEDGAGRVPNQRFGHGAEKYAVNPLVAVRSYDDEIRFEVAGELRNLDLGVTHTNVNDDPGDRARKVSSKLFELVLRLVDDGRDMERFDGLRRRRFQHVEQVQLARTSSSNDRSGAHHGF
jgi:hypothetical protein